MALIAKIKVVAIVGGERREFAPGENLEGVLSTHDIVSLKQLRALEDSDQVEAKARRNAVSERMANDDFQAARELVKQSQASLAPVDGNNLGNWPIQAMVAAVGDALGINPTDANASAAVGTTDAGAPAVASSVTEQPAAVPTSANNPVPGTDGTALDSGVADVAQAANTAINQDQATAVETAAAQEKPKRKGPAARQA